jgi:hypothetical protein
MGDAGYSSTTIPMVILWSESSIGSATTFQCLSTNELNIHRGRALRFGVISDTHGQLEPTQHAVRILQSLEVEVVLHCGDIGTADVVRQFQLIGI